MSTTTTQVRPLLLVALLCIYTVCAHNCPAADTACRCHGDNIICVDLEQRTDIPAFSPSSRVFSMLSFQGDTRILRIQSRAFAGLQVRIIDLSDLGLNSLDPAAFSGLNASVLSELILTNNSLQALPVTVFAGLTSLSVLDIRNNYITELSANVFSDLRPSLTTLLISNNLISGLPGGVLGGLGQLRRLDIEDNLLRRWSPAMLIGTTRITELSLAGNRIITFPRGSFNSLQQLVKLCLDRNDIMTLSSGTFRNLTSLRELDLSGNRLRFLNEHILEGLGSLMMLNLSINELSEMRSSALSPLIALQSLDLSHNLLRRLPDGLFTNMTTLMSVNLSGNNLTIFSETFRGLTSLTELFLSGNSICIISSRLFADLNQLRVLDLSDNKIMEMETDFLSFSTEIETVNLANNKLVKIPSKGFNNGPSLTTIDLSRNTIRRVNRDAFYNLRLIDIDLSYNEIEFIDPDAFQHVATLRTVLLNHNNLVEVPSELLRNIILLNKLDLDYNLLETLPPGAFDGLYVEDLSLASNIIGSVDPRAFEGSLIINSINLAKNRIEHIPNNTFNYRELSKLSHLSLSYNILTEVAGEMIAGLSGLTTLDLSNNQIHKMADGAFTALWTLSTLRLDGNRLESINYSCIGDIETLRSLNMSFNRLNNQALRALSGLHGLTELYLDSNNLSSLALLPRITSIKTLCVRNNSLSSVSCSGSMSIDVLDLGQNRLRSDTLAVDLKTYHNLTSLRLDGNELKVLPSNVFAPFASRLEELDLSNNGLNSTSLAAFSALTSIRILIVDDNHFNDVSYLSETPMKKVLRIFSAKRNRLNSTVFSALSNFTKLHQLLLDSNEIDFIPDHVFQSIYNVRVLSLQGNALQNISSRTFLGLKQTCQHLDLSNNRLSQVEALSLLKNLEHLNLSENNLTSVTLPPIMTNLQVLNLAGNRLQIFPFPSQLRRLPKISTLNVSRNSMIGLSPMEIFGNSKKVAVDFQRNNLLDIGNLRLIGSFGHVDFSSNNLNDDLSPTTLKRVKYVDQLDLSKNKLRIISPTIWQTVFTVNRLNISRNHLLYSLSLATEYEKCGTVLTTLDLSYNSLALVESFSDQIASLSSSLAVLDIRNNFFESLPERAFNNMTKMTHLFLAENWWNCNCDLVWIRELQSRDIAVDNAKCVFPASTRSQLVVCYTPPDSCHVDHPTN